MNAEKPSLSIALKTLWGATEMPFGDACAEPYRHPSFEELTRRLQQLCEIGASGLVHGPNGIGKSYLCGCFTDKLPEKRYKILSLAHSSLTGSDLIRSLCRQLGVQPQMRRSDNVANIHAALGQLGSRWPLLVLEEAQNFSASALEEVRLLTCARSDTRPPFSLLLIGEDSLLPRLQMGINHALISRLGFAWPSLGSSLHSPVNTSVHGFAPSVSIPIPSRIKGSNCSSRLPADCPAPSITWPSVRSKPRPPPLRQPSARHTFKPL
jgi:hypothetical protein